MDNRLHIQKEKRKKGRCMNLRFEYYKKYTLIIVCLLFPLFSVYAADSIIVYRLGDKSEPIWGMFKKSFDSKGYNMSIYEGADNIDIHLEHVNRINKTNASLMLALDLSIKEKEDIFIAYTNTKKGKGRFLTIEEIHGQHIDKSIALAKDIATSFNKNVKEISVFPLLGVDMPGVFIRIACTKELAGETLNKLHEGIQKYIKRGQ